MDSSLDWPMIDIEAQWQQIVVSRFSTIKLKFRDCGGMAFRPVGKGCVPIHTLVTDSAVVANEQVMLFESHLSRQACAIGTQSPRQIQCGELHR